MALAKYLGLVNLLLVNLLLNIHRHDCEHVHCTNIRVHKILDISAASARMKCS